MACLSLIEAKALQKALRGRVSLRTSVFAKNLRTVGGVDCAYATIKGRPRVFACAVVLSFPMLELIDEAFHARPVTFPYIPGYLSFRELPSMLGALTKLKIVPDVLFVSGQGVAHPRGLGIASHLGVVAGLATIGIAKKPLFGLFQAPSMEAGSVSAITHPDDGSVIGFVVRAKTNVKPLYVSPGHRMDAETAVSIALQCIQKTKLPVPLHLADRLADRLKKAFQRATGPDSVECLEPNPVEYVLAKNP